MAKFDSGAVTWASRAGYTMERFLEEAESTLVAKGYLPDQYPGLLDEVNSKIQQEHIDQAKALGIVDPPRDDGRLPGLWEFNQIAALLNKRHRLKVEFSVETAEELRSALHFVRGMHFRVRDAADLKEVIALSQRLTKGAEVVAEFSGLTRTGMSSSRAIELHAELTGALVDLGVARDDDHAFLQLRAIDDIVLGLGIASREMTKRLKATDVKEGRGQLRDFDEFLLLIARVAVSFGIKPKRRTNRTTAEPDGPFFDLVTEFETFLPNAMWCETPAARDGRIRACMSRHRDRWKKLAARM